MFDLSTQLFALPEETRQTYLYPTEPDTGYFGLITAEREQFVPGQPVDVKEIFYFNYGYDPEEKDFFLKTIEKNCESTFRFAYYPKVSDYSGLEPGQMRCGEHSDYGNITILFQDDCGGLEVMNKQGEYVEATLIKDTALINVADFLSMCSGGRLKSTVHRVRIPKENFHRPCYLLVYFCEPDPDKATKPIFDADENFKPVTYREWRKQKFYYTGFVSTE